LNNIGRNSRIDSLTAYFTVKRHAAPQGFHNLQRLEPQEYAQLHPCRLLQQPLR